MEKPYIFSFIQYFPFSDIINIICVGFLFFVVTIGLCFILYASFKVFALKDPIKSPKEEDIYQHI